LHHARMNQKSLASANLR